MPANPIRITVWDAAGALMDWVGTSLSVRVTARAAAPSEAVIVLDSDDEQVGPLAAPGSRAAVDLLVDPATETWSRLVVGEVVERSGSSQEASTTTFTIGDARSLVLGLAIHPAPAMAPVAGVATTVGAAQRSITGPAETVLKTLVGENAAWQGLTTSIVPDLRRGAQITIDTRFGQLADMWDDFLAAGIMPVVDVAGPGWSVDVEPTATNPQVLTQASGIVQGGTWKALPPTVTRSVVLGAGEAANRQVVMVVDTEAEKRWGPRAVVRDARGVNAGDTAGLIAQGLSDIADGAATAQVTASLSQTEDFRFGVTFGLGDTVTVRLDGAPDITSTVSEVVVTWDTSSGLVVVPHVGDTDTTFEAVIATAVAALDSRVRTSGRSL